MLVECAFALLVVLLAEAILAGDLIAACIAKQETMLLTGRAFMFLSLGFGELVDRALFFFREIGRVSRLGMAIHNGRL